METSRLVLGCGNFGGIGSAPAFFGQGETRDEAFALMDAAWEASIRRFDTADAYGGGRSETWIGGWMRDRGVRPALTTKVFHSVVGDPGDRGLAPARIRRQLEGSLERLGVERVDLYLTHEPDPDTPLEDTLGALAELRTRGSSPHSGSRTSTRRRRAARSNSRRSRPCRTRTRSSTATPSRSSTCPSASRRSARSPAAG